MSYDHRLSIIDELVFSPETRTLSWQMMTRATVTVGERGVFLEQDGAGLYLSIGGETPFEVRVVSLSPPPLSYDKNIEGLKRLEILWQRESFAGNTARLIIEMDAKEP